MAGVCVAFVAYGLGFWACVRRIRGRGGKTTFAALPVLARRGSLPPRLRRVWFLCLGNLRNELADDCFTKRIEILGDHDECAWAANDVVAVVVLQTAGRIGVLRIPWQWSFAKDCEPIHRDSLRHGLIA